MIWDIINGIGTLLFAAITLFAIFYPEIKNYYKRAKFSYKVEQYGPSDNKSIFIKVKNTGKSPAYGLRCLLQVRYKESVILDGKQLPTRRLTSDGKPGEVYDGIDLYPMEEAQFQLMHFGSRRTGQPRNLLEITTYPWKWDSDFYAELNSFDRNELKVTSEQTYQLFITLVDKNRVYSAIKFEFSYDGNIVKIL